MWIAVVVPVMKSGEKGGAEALYKGLVKGLRQTAHEVDRIDVVIDESTFEAVLESYETCANLDLHDYDLVISTKAPTYMVRHRNHISYLLHTLRVFYDRFHQEFGRGTLEQFRQRRRIHTLDKTGLHPDRVKRHFAIGHAPYKRLYDVDTFWQQIKFEVLYPAPLLEDFREPRAGEYVFLPGRLHRWKRVDLVIQAFRYVTQDIPLKIAGVGEDEPSLRALAAGDRRIEFLGRVSDAQLLDLYAGALVVPFVPVDEDYGFITIEAFRSKKPVITCVDSGEPTYFVKHCESGFVVKPEPEAIAEKINYLIDHPEHAAEMGEKGAAAVPHISWDRVVAKLLAAVEIPQRRVRKWVRSPAFQRPLKVLITDNQCIEPAVGGSRLRLLGLYGTLTEGIEATYVGTYNWRGPGYRELQLSERLREIDVPQSEAHFAINDHLNTLLPGKTIIDVTMPWLVWSSPELVETLQKHAQEAEVAIFSHPWMYGCVRDIVRARERLIIYDAQNCEAVLRAQLLGSHEFGRCLSQSVRAIEGLLCQESDLILACSEEDKQAFVAVHGVQAEKIVIVPNGVDIQNIQPVSAAARVQAKDALGIAGFAALFIGIAYPPNLEAARLIIDQLAPANPDVTFIIVGSVGERIAVEIDRSNRPSNVKLLGAVSDEVRNRAYAAADIAINPMFTGSGTNIKMLDFLAAGLPTVTTPIGARGINNRHAACFIVDDIGQFNDWIRTLQADPQLCAKLAVNGRKLAEDLYDWRAISERLGQLILQHAKRRSAATTRPYFSVVIPSYERPQSLTKLLRLLTRQAFTDFEVIVVDQSAAVLDLEALRCNFPIQYLHTSEKGAGKARNLGIAHARGRVVAFTDDDCEPDDCWLANAYKYFKDEEVVGIEGRIESDTTDEERYRIVTNHGLEGLGFMTANLFLRKDVLDKIGGFDERFRSPFREDTDLAWRALSCGKIPFAPDVKVLHPAHRRDMQRESRDARSKFFEYDPLLFHKHPKRYLQLLKTEAHYARAPGFWEHFMRGMLKHKVEIPVEDLREYTTPAQYSLLCEIAKQLDSASLDSPYPVDSASRTITEPAELLPGMASIAGNTISDLPSEATVTTANPVPNGKIAELIHHFQILLEAYQNLDYGRQLNPVDAFFAFRLLLGRNPEPTRELPALLIDTHTFREFLSDLLHSEEFSRCVGFMPPNRVLMAQLEDFRLWFNTSDREMGAIMVSGQYEPKSVDLIKRIVEPGMKCIDAGAHIGFFTCLFASLVGEGGKVYAFEPMPSNFELLVRNIHENHFEKRVQLYRLACSDTSTRLIASKVSNMYVVGQIGDAERAEMETVRLDDIIEETINVVKLDVEGHEPAVIRGMIAIISRDKPIILSEINEYWLHTCSNSNAREYVGLLKSLDYEVFDVRNLDHPINAESLDLDILDTLDLVALPLGRGW